MSRLASTERVECLLALAHRVVVAAVRRAKMKRVHAIEKAIAVDEETARVELDALEYARVRVDTIHVARQTLDSHFFTFFFSPDFKF